MKSRKPLAIISTSILILSLGAAGCALRKTNAHAKKQNPPPAPGAAAPAPTNSPSPEALAEGNALVGTSWKSSCHGVQKNFGDNLHPGQITEFKFETAKRVRKLISSYIDADCKELATVDEFYGGYLVGRELNGQPGVLEIDLNAGYLASTPMDDATLEKYRDDYRNIKDWAKGTRTEVTDKTKVDVDAGHTGDFLDIFTVKDGKLFMGKWDPQSKYRPTELDMSIPYEKTSPAAEAPKSDAPAPADQAPKADAPKADAPKADAPKADAPKADAPKTPATPVEPPKSDAPKADAPKADAPKADAPKADTSTPPNPGPQAETAPAAPKAKVKAPAPAKKK